MKSREEFIKSVWEKSEKALSEEIKSGGNRFVFRKRKGRKYGTLAAAACMILAVGTISFGGFDAIYDGGLSILGVDGAASESISEEAPQDTDCSTENRGSSSPTAGNTAEDGADGMVSSPTIMADGTLNYTILEDDELYGELKKQTEEASKSEDLQMYYFLPIGVRIEDFEGNLIIDVTDEKGVKKYMKWFYNLPEEQVLTNEEFEAADNPGISYKFIMDCSMGADVDSVDRNFWILGEVQIP